MARSMKREEAIRLLAEVDLSLLSPEERAEQLETMMCEDWESHREWSSLSSLVRQEFAQQREIDEPCASRYDPVLLLWLTYGYAGVRNDFLLARLREVGHQASAIERFTSHHETSKRVLLVLSQEFSGRWAAG